MKLVLFDIDGTLILSGGAGMKSLAQTFEELFALPNAADGIPFHGHTDPIILQAYQRQLSGWLEGIRSFCRSRDVSYVQVSTATGWDQFVLSHLRREGVVK